MKQSSPTTRSANNYNNISNNNNNNIINSNKYDSLSTADQKTLDESCHDAMLDQLHTSILQTKAHATNIHSELGDHDVLLSELSDGVSIANIETRRQTQSVGELLQDTRHRGFYIIVIVLVLVILTLLWV
eukprot:Tbor_TRINITY_DN5255_c2_g1::TRINITY_DN5255_c2_g1_i1::g.16603::m.16603